MKENEFNFETISGDTDTFKSYTGLPLERFKQLFKLVDPGQNAENMNYYETSKAATEDQVSRNVNLDHDYAQQHSRAKNRGPKLKMSPINQLFLFMVWLRCGLPLFHLVFLFKKKKSTISRCMITWSNYLYFTLGSIPIWPTKQQIVDSMPACFKNTYPSTRVIIDCTELYVQVPSSLAIQSALYSCYKHRCTYKGLLGISPSGAVTFISQLYPGFIYDKEIVARSGFLNPAFWEAGDSVMADRGFNIQDALKELGVEQNIPAFLDGRDQLEEEEVIESQIIASVRIHAERCISRLKSSGH